MVKFYPSLPTTPDLTTWILAQPLFFISSAPLSGLHINLSPKGLPSASFRVLSPSRVAYQDATGSGCETIAHVYENGRVTLMFCGFGESPRILRLFCRGRVVERGGGAEREGVDGERWMSALRECGMQEQPGARAIIFLDIWKVQTSCGFGVPKLSLLPPSPPSSSSSPTPEPTLTDRPTLSAFNRTKEFTNALLPYQTANNAVSLDGLVGLHSAVRRRGRRVGVEKWKARVRHLLRGQWAGLLVGWVVGVLGVLLAVRMGEGGRAEVVARGVGGVGGLVLVLGWCCFWGGVEGKVESVGSAN